jgi:hypothetical protein
MKKFLVLIAAIGLSLHSFAYDPINEKLIESFKSSFPRAQQVSWQELDKTFVVTFVEENIRARAFFNKDGNLVQLIRYYKEQQLPFSVLHTIQKNFRGKKIFGVVEVTTANAGKNMETEYHVKLEDGRSWTTVKVYASGHSEITQRLRKV